MVPPHFIVFVPGFMGSQLRDRTTGKTVWLDFSSVPLNPLQWDDWFNHLFQQMLYPNPNLEPAGIVQDVLFAPPWIKQEQYSRLLRILESWGYHTDPARHPEAELTVYTFAYDWRQDNRLSGKQLGEAIERWRGFHPGAQVWLMGHSNGGIVSRWYIEKEGGKDRVSRLILLASPWDGAAKAMYMLFQGMDTLFRMRFQLLGLPERTRQALRTFPSAYQLIPQAASFLHGPDGSAVDPFVPEPWLDDAHERDMLEDGRRFNRELGNALSVETLAFFGCKLPTTTGGSVHFGPNNRWDQIDWQVTGTGDGTLAEHTAVFPTTDRNIPIIAGHGDIYVHPALYEILRWELVDKYAGFKGTVTFSTDRYQVALTTDKDVYEPGAPIALSVRVQARGETRPVDRVQVSAKLTWLQPLPGSPTSQRPRRLPRPRLTASPDAPGQFAGTVKAPKSEGYYNVEATIAIPGEQPLALTEMILVEGVPDQD